MSKQDIKIAVRYAIILYFCYLAWDVTRPEYLQEIKSVGEIAVGAIYTSIFGVLGWIVKSNWSTTPSEDK
jgi:hypothetical protein